MMKSLNELKTDLTTIGLEIRRTLEKYKNDAGRLSMFNLDVPETPDGVFLRNELWSALSALSRVTDDLEYLEKPVTAEGVLTRTPDDKWTLAGIPIRVEADLRRGTVIEIMTESEYEHRPYWVSGWIVPDSDGGFHFCGASNARLDGATARIRG